MKEKIKKYFKIVVYIFVWFLFSFSFIGIIFALLNLDEVKKWGMVFSVFLLLLMSFFVIRKQLIFIINLFYKKLILNKNMRNFLKDNWFKVGIIIAIIICGAFIYQSQVIKQESIEWQQQQELRVKTEQANKEYVASQKKACMDIYETEGKKYNNVKSWYYDEEYDKCQITYNDPNKKSQSQCEKEYNSCKELLGEDNTYCLTSKWRCIDGVFIKAF